MPHSRTSRGRRPLCHTAPLKLRPWPRIAAASRCREVHAGRQKRRSTRGGRIVCAEERRLCVGGGRCVCVCVRWGAAHLVHRVHLRVAGAAEERACGHGGAEAGAQDESQDARVSVGPPAPVAPPSSPRPAPHCCVGPYDPRAGHPPSPWQKTVASSLSQASQMAMKAPSAFIAAPAARARSDAAGRLAACSSLHAGPTPPQASGARTRGKGTRRGVCTHVGGSSGPVGRWLGTPVGGGGALWAGAAASEKWR